MAPPPIKMVRRSSFNEPPDELPEPKAVGGADGNAAVREQSSWMSPNWLNRGRKAATPSSHASSKYSSSKYSSSKHNSSQALHSNKYRSGKFQSSKKMSPLGAATNSKNSSGKGSLPGSSKMRGGGGGAQVHPSASYGMNSGSVLYDFPGAHLASGNLAALKAHDEPHLQRRIADMGLAQYFRALQAQWAASHYMLKRYLQRVLTTGSTGVVIDWTGFALSVTACLTLVWSTYSWNLEKVFTSINLIICIFLTLEFLLRLFVADSRAKFLASSASVIDLLTLVPMYLDVAEVVSYGDHPMMTDADGNFVAQMQANNFWPLMDMLRVLRVLRLRRVCVYVDDEASRETVRLILDIFAICFASSGIVYSLENTFRPMMGAEPLGFHDCFYFTVVTVSTVGYGDVKVVTGPGQLFISFLIVVCVVYIPKSTNALLRVFSESSQYAVRKFKPVVKMRHVLITGEMHADGALEFFKEFFHPDHGDTVDEHVVLLMDKPPSAEMRAVIEHMRYEMVVTYLQGSVYSDVDLARARASQASACFVLADKFAADPVRTDTESLLKALALKQYFRRTNSPVKICIQVARPENKQRFLRGNGGSDAGAAKLALTPHLSPQPGQPAAPHHGGGGSLSGGNHVGPPATEQNDIAICIDQIKMHLLAKSCLCPGINTIVSNLIISSQSGAIPTPRTEPGSAEDWVVEYTRGCEYEIYRTAPLSAAFTDYLYKDLVNGIYRETGTLIIGVEIHLTLYDGTTDVRLLLNPVELVIPSPSECKVYAFVFAKDDAGADLNALFQKEGQGGGNEQKSSFLNSAKPNKYAGTGSVMYAFGGQQIERNRTMQEVIESYRTVAPNVRYSRKRSVAHPGFAAQSDGQPQAQGTTSAAAPTGPSADSRASASSKAQAQAKAMAQAERESCEENGVTSLDDATILTSLAEERPTVRNHVFFTGSMTNLASFVEVLCGAASGALCDSSCVVVLNQDPPDEAVWDKISHYNVLYIEGSALDAYDLKRAGVGYARCAVISAWDRSASANDASNEDEGAGKRGTAQNYEVVVGTDADVIFAHQGIKKLNPMIDIITEIIDASNVVFLETKLSRLAGSHANEAPGPQKQSSSVDNVVDGGDPAAVAPALEDTGDARTSMEEDDSELVGAETGDASDRRITAGLLASGCVFSVSLLDTLICQSYYNPQILNVIEAVLIGVKEPDPAHKLEWDALLGTNDSSATMYRIPVPRMYWNKTYGELFSYMLVDLDISCIGLMRGLHTKKGLGLGHANNCYPYVVTNPNHGTVLRAEDYVFCFSQEKPEFLLPAEGRKLQKVSNNLLGKLGKKKAGFGSGS